MLDVYGRIVPSRQKRLAGGLSKPLPPINMSWSLIPAPFLHRYHSHLVRLPKESFHLPTRGNPTQWQTSVQILPSATVTRDARTNC